LPAGDFIEPDVAQARLEELIHVTRDVQRRINRREVGRACEVLVEKEARGVGQVLGRTRRNKVVAFEGDASLIGSYVTVVLEGTSGSTFVGSREPEPVLAGRP
jgi:tRNA A37 methylthiotransferase MiaB